MALIAYYAFWVALVVFVPFALWKGAGPERLGALVILAMTATALILVMILGQEGLRASSWLILTDVVGFFGFGYLALHSMRSWPLWCTALQLLALLSHVAHFSWTGISPLAYAYMRGTPTFFALFVLCAATLSVLRRKHEGLHDRMWQDWKALRRRGQ